MPMLTVEFTSDLLGLNAVRLTHHTPRSPKETGRAHPGPLASELVEICFVVLVFG